MKVTKDHFCETVGVSTNTLTLSSLTQPKLHPVKHASGNRLRRTGRSLQRQHHQFYSFILRHGKGYGFSTKLFPDGSSKVCEKNRAKIFN